MLGRAVVVRCPGGRIDLLFAAIWKWQSVVGAARHLLAVVCCRQSADLDHLSLGAVTDWH